ncbi:MAG: flavodoxin family protein [Patescibacteria group bacterium]|jgi:flavodoxin I
MKTLIIYDSRFGNTEKVANAIAKGIGKPGEVTVSKIGKENFSDLKAINLLIIGSPTYGGRPTQPVQNLLNKISGNELKDKNVAAFDTRAEADSFGLKLLIKVLGFAAPRIALILKGKGGNLVATPEGFIVEGKEGPLKEGELKRAEEWGRKIKNSKQ